MSAIFVRGAFLACVAVASVGCTVGQRDSDAIPKGWKSYVAPGNNVTYVLPVQMDDGTRCVVVIGNNAGRGVSCDWKAE